MVQDVIFIRKREGKGKTRFEEEKKKAKEWAYVWTGLFKEAGGNKERGRLPNPEGSASRKDSSLQGDFV